MTDLGFDRFRSLSDIHSMTETSQEGVILKLDPSEIEVSPQVRKRFENIDELAESMRKGQEQPIVVGPMNPDTKKYPLQKGERRVRAAVLIGNGYKLEAKVNAKVQTPSEEVTSQLTENLQRESLLPLEIAAALLDLREKLRNEGKKYTGKALAEEVSKPESWVSMHLNMAQLPAELKDLVENDVITDPEVIQSLRKISIEQPGLYAQLLEQSQSETGLTRADIRAHMKALKGRSSPDEVAPTPQMPSGTTSVPVGSPSAAVATTSTGESPGLQVGTELQVPPNSVGVEPKVDPGQTTACPVAQRNAVGSRRKGKPEIVEVPLGQSVIHVRVALDEGLIFGELLTDRAVKDDTGWGVVAYLDGGKPKVEAFTLDRIEFVSIAQLATGD